GANVTPKNESNRPYQTTSVSSDSSLNSAPLVGPNTIKQAAQTAKRSNDRGRYCNATTRTPEDASKPMSIRRRGLSSMSKSNLSHSKRIERRRIDESGAQIVSATVADVNGGSHRS